MEFVNPQLLWLQYRLYRMAQLIIYLMKMIALGKTDLIVFRQKLGITDEKHTIAVAKTDIPSLQHKMFEGASPNVRKNAGLPEVKPGPIKSPSPNPLFTKHAEEDIVNQFVAAVEKYGLTPIDLKGRTLFMHISNPSGVCNVCRQGLKNSRVKPGVLKQLSQRYPELTLSVTVEPSGEKVRGGAKLIILNGELVN